MIQFWTYLAIGLVLTACGGGGSNNANVGESDSLGSKLTSSSSGCDAGGGVGGRMRNDDDDQSKAAIFFHRSFLFMVVMSDSHILCQTHTSCVNLAHPVLILAHLI